jgi:Cdc6-like AAA superfamily ATPase
LDPAASPQKALRDTTYIEPPSRSLATRLVTGLQLAPVSTHLVVGTIGNGKSTELMVAARRMREIEDTHAFYIDVAQHHDLSKGLRGVLLALAGLKLGDLLKDNGDKAVAKIITRFKDWAYDHLEFEPYDPFEDDYEPDDPGEPGRYVKKRGVLRPPDPLSDSEIQRQIKSLKTLKQALPESKRHVVLFFDSLDRLSDVDRFRQVVLEDVRALQAAGLGVVLVGPPRVLYGPHRSIVDLTDQHHMQLAFDISMKPTFGFDDSTAPSDPSSFEFLDKVLLRRTDDGVLPSQQRASLISWSGGVLRDLLSLARGAFEEAYLEGDDQVGEDHINQAADRFGRSMMLGLRDGELAKLKQLAQRGSFVPTTDDDLALIETRRVLEVSGLKTRYIVHPTIKLLLEKVALVTDPAGRRPNPQPLPDTGRGVSQQKSRSGSPFPYREGGWGVRSGGRAYDQGREGVGRMSALVPITPEKLALRIALSRSTNTWCGLVAAGTTLAGVAARIKAALQDGGLDNTEMNPPFAALSSFVSSTAVILIVAGDPNDQEVWQALDPNRSQVNRRGATLVVMTELVAEVLPNKAPHLMSWLGGSLYQLSTVNDQVKALIEEDRISDARKLIADHPDEVESSLVRALEPPRFTRRPASGRGDYQKNRSWLRENRHNYQGLWVALNGDTLVASNQNLIELQEQLKSHPDLDHLLFTKVGW